ncbi:hypothetical protein [[Flexibacter] sp. ATCC 35208]|uniref:hypothetical protein n=1 Tax=[Flexibacter] sp. ATCC 35208 TaxID=1936242 RepID=UPI00117DCE99|nr:hypothetical protein [[Flexibacter] sp. ATCC 35208]
MFATACKENQKEIVTIHAVGLSADTLNIGPMFFLNRDTGFIAGCSLVNTKNPNYPGKDDREYLRTKWEAILFKTIDGGKTWTNKIFGEGCIVQIDRFGDSIIALMKNNYYTRVFTSSVYSPDNWREISSFPRYASQIFFSGDQMAAIATDSFKFHNFLCFSDNGGKNWSANYDPIHVPYQVPVLKDDKLFYLARHAGDNRYPDSLVVYDIHSHIDQVITLPKGFVCLDFTCFQNSIRLTGMMGGKIAVYAVEQNLGFKEQYTYAANNISGPLRFYKSSNADWIFAVEKNGQKKKIVIIKTSDNGRSFKTFKVDYILNIYLRSFIEQDSVVKAWFFDGSEKFQVFESGNK